jgi:hypothetical protein
MSFKDMCAKLESEIEASYTEGVSLDEAEKLAGKFLSAQISVSRELQKLDLDSRMRKSGVKAVKAVIYKDECSKADKKPTESQLEHSLNSNELVISEQTGLDEAESSRDELSRLFNIFGNAHLHFRGIAKGRFE